MCECGAAMGETNGRWKSRLYGDIAEARSQPTAASLHHTASYIEALCTFLKSLSGLKPCALAKAHGTSAVCQLRRVTARNQQRRMLSRRARKHTAHPEVKNIYEACLSERAPLQHITHKACHALGHLRNRHAS